jgi:hypothetical protein
MRIVTARPVTVAACCALALLAIQGCSSGHGGTGKTTTAGQLKPIPLDVAMQQMQVQGSLEKSVAATVLVHVTDGTGGKTTTTSVGTVQAVLKPSTISQADLQLTTAGKTVPMQEVESGGITYIKFAQLSGMTGKPWVAISGSASSPGISMAQGGNPLASDQYLAFSKNLHTVGTAVVNKVGTTEYEGSYPASAMLSGLPASLKKQTAAELKNASPVSISVWISAQGRVQKVVSTEKLSTETITTNIDITGVNLPLHIAVPPSSQVAHIPASALGGM